MSMALLSLKRILVVSPSIILLLIFLLNSVIVDYYPTAVHVERVKVEVGKVEAGETAQQSEILLTRDRWIYPMMMEELNSNDTSLTSSIDTIGKWQQEQVKKFCAKYGLTSYGERGRVIRDMHFLFNKERKIIFCFVPKVGCTYMKEFMFVLAGVIPASAVTEEMKTVPHKDFHQGLHIASFGWNKALSTREKLDMLDTYWKFTIVRNPLERLVSAFRNKLSGPIRTKAYAMVFEYIKHEILKKYDTAKYNLWAKKKDRSNVTITFTMFIKWIISKPAMGLDDHFKPVYLVTRPCTVKYNFFGHFRDMTSDMHLVMDKFSIPKELYRDYGYYKSSQNTTTVLMQYYSALSMELKQALFQNLKTELDFYYHLFPDERHSHVMLLGVNDEVYY